MHTKLQGLNQGQTVGQALKRPTSEITDVKHVSTKRAKISANSAPSLSGINFARSRMFCSRPTLNSLGYVAFGFRHNRGLRNVFFCSCINIPAPHGTNTWNGVDVLNRYSNGQSREENLHVLQTIFPKQFGLSNVFTSGFKSNIQLEEEINRLAIKNHGKPPFVPKRLSGTTLELVAKLQKLQSQCPYSFLLRYYCPASVRPHFLIS